MAVQQTSPRILVGPRCLDDRICRLVYVRATDEVWTEEWRSDGWVRTSALVRHVLKAPSPEHRILEQRGIPLEVGDWDHAEAYA
jgi:hypothetical protein